jgi:hypothetical protein
VSGVYVSGFGAALIGALVLALVNAIVKPIMILFTLPLTILTLGLFLFVVNALMLWLVAALVPGIHIRGFGAALIGSLQSNDSLNQCPALATFDHPNLHYAFLATTVRRRHIHFNVAVVPRLWLGRDAVKQFHFVYLDLEHPSSVASQLFRLLSSLLKLLTDRLFDIGRGWLARAPCKTKYSEN